MRGATNLRTFCIAIPLVFALATVTLGQQAESPPSDPTPLLEQFKSAMLARQSVAQYLTPELSPEQRRKIAESEMRPYLVFTILYNPADLIRTDASHAEIPVLIQWQTATTTFDGNGKIHFVSIDGRWYLADLNVMSFPWVLVGVCSMLGLAFGIFVFVLVRRSKKKKLASLQPVSE